MLKYAENAGKTFMVNVQDRPNQGAAELENPLQSDFRPAIFCSDPTAVTETFVRRHIKLLNGGNTLVFGEVDVDKDVFSRISPNASYSSLLMRHRPVRRLCRLLARNPLTQKIALSLWRRLVSHEIAGQKFDLIVFEFGYIAARHWDYALFSDKPFFIYFRGIDASRLLRQESYVQTIRLLATRASGIIFVAPTLKNNLLRHGIALPESLVLPSGVDTRLFRPGNKKGDMCVSVGRFIEKKGHDDTIRAFARVSLLYPDLRLIIFGDGPMLADCKTLARMLEVAEKIDFPGAVEHTVIRDALQQATFYFQASKTSSDGDTEGFPSAIQEALASGAVVVCTRHAGANDFLEHELNAMLFAEGDVDGMVSVISKLLEDKNMLMKLSVNGRDYAERFLDARSGIARLNGFFRRCLIGEQGR